MTLTKEREREKVFFRVSAKQHLQTGSDWFTFRTRSANKLTGPGHVTGQVNFSDIFLISWLANHVSSRDWCWKSYFFRLTLDGDDLVQMEEYRQNCGCKHVVRGMLCCLFFV